MGWAKLDNPTLEILYASPKLFCVRTRVYFYIVRWTRGWHDKKTVDGKVKQIQRKEDSFSNRSIARCIGADSGSVGRALAELEQSGFLVRSFRGCGRTASVWGIGDELRIPEDSRRNDEQIACSGGKSAPLGVQICTSRGSKSAPLLKKEEKKEFKERGKERGAPAPPLLGKFKEIFKEEVGETLPLNDFANRDFQQFFEQVDPEEDILLEAWKCFLEKYRGDDFLQKQDPFKHFLKTSPPYLAQAKGSRGSNLEEWLRGHRDEPGTRQEDWEDSGQLQEHEKLTPENMEAIERLSKAGAEIEGRQEAVANQTESKAMEAQSVAEDKPESRQESSLYADKRYADMSEDERLETNREIYLDCYRERGPREADKFWKRMRYSIAPPNPDDYPEEQETESKPEDKAPVREKVRKRRELILRIIANAQTSLSYESLRKYLEVGGVSVSIRTICSDLTALRKEAGGDLKDGRGMHTLLSPEVFNRRTLICAILAEAKAWLSEEKIQKRLEELGFPADPENIFTDLAAIKSQSIRAAELREEREKPPRLPSEEVAKRLGIKVIHRPRKPA